MKSSLLWQLLLLSWTGSALAQAKPHEIVRCAPDSIEDKLRHLMQWMEFNHDSSYVDFVPDSAFSDLGLKAQIIQDLPTCRRAHAVFIQDALESEHWPDRVAVARVGSFYFIYEGDVELIVVDRNWKHVAKFGYGL